jgi:PAS domain S-box-containing protein
MENILYKRCALLNTISENIEAPFWIKDIDNRYVFGSEKLLKEIIGLESENSIIGYSDEELEKSFINNLICKDMSNVSNISDELVKKQYSTLRFYEIFNTDKEKVMFDVKKTPLRTMGGEIIGTVGIAYNITKEMNDIFIGLHKRVEKGDVIEWIKNKLYQLKKV